MSKNSAHKLLVIRNIIDEAKCYQTVRDLRWPEEIQCPHCDSFKIIKYGKDETEQHRQKYKCNNCIRYFDDLTNTIFAGHHKPLSVWILCLYFMGLNLSTMQISQELDLNKDDAYQMTSQLREGVVVRKPGVQLGGDVECDEVYVVAGHKGNPGAVKKSPRGASKPAEGRKRKRNS